MQKVRKCLMVVVTGLVCASSVHTACASEATQYRDMKYIWRTQAKIGDLFADVQKMLSTLPALSFLSVPLTLLVVSTKTCFDVLLPFYQRNKMDFSPADVERIDKVCDDVDAAKRALAPALSGLRTAQERVLYAQWQTPSFADFKQKCLQVFAGSRAAALDYQSLVNLLAACTELLRRQAGPGAQDEKDNIIVRKLELKPNDVVAIHADIHADAQSLLVYLETLAERGYLDTTNPFTIAQAHKNDFYLFFTGDHGGRGDYTSEVYAMLCTLCLCNPDHVFMFKGNHEEMVSGVGRADLVALVQTYPEATGKDYGVSFFARFNRLWSYLPSAVFVGCRQADGSKDFMILCHAGVEYFGRVSELAALQNMLADKDRTGSMLLSRVIDDENPVVRTLVANVASKADLEGFDGFVWTDFCVRPAVNEDNSWFDGRRGLAAGRLLTKQVLAGYSTRTSRVHGYIRGHQHGDIDDWHPLMQLMVNKDNLLPAADCGVAKLWLLDASAKKGDDGRPLAGALWDGIVCTLLVSPFAGYPGVDFDTFALLKVNDGVFDNWRLEVVQTPADEIERKTKPSAVPAQPAATVVFGTTEVGRTTQIGTRHAGRSNEDRFDAQANERYEIHAVYDGHGGSAVAEYAREHLAKELLAVLPADGNNVEQAVKTFFVSFDTNMPIEKKSAGSTASLLIVDAIAHRAYAVVLGDSEIFRLRANVLARTDLRHRPDTASEGARIVSAGGWIDEDGYVKGRINVTRALGDFEQKLLVTNGQKLIIAEPEIKVWDIQAGDTFMLVCDGVWSEGKLTDADYREAAKKLVGDAAAFLVQRALENGSTDDLTAVVVRVRA